VFPEFLSAIAYHSSLRRQHVGDPAEHLGALRVAQRAQRGPPDLAGVAERALDVQPDGARARHDLAGRRIDQRRTLTLASDPPPGQIALEKNRRSSDHNNRARTHRRGYACRSQPQALYCMLVGLQA